ncbi:hypothetical protein CHS0354_001392, partial [Potamilus streckersoni]
VKRRNSGNLVLAHYRNTTIEHGASSRGLIVLRARGCISCRKYPSVKVIDPPAAALIGWLR